MYGQSQLRETVLEWCLPVVHDCLHEFYAKHFPPRSSAVSTLTQLHFKLWSSLVRGDDRGGQADAAILSQKASRLKLNPEVCAAGNRYVAAEILDLSLRRFRRMPEAAKRNNQELLAILLRLTSSAPSTSYKQAA